MVKVKAGKRYYMKTVTKKRARVAKPIPEKIDFKTTIVDGDKEVQFIIMMIKGSTVQDDMTVINTYTANNRELKYIKPQSIEGIDNSTIIV